MNIAEKLSKLVVEIRVLEGTGCYKGHRGLLFSDALERTFPELMGELESGPLDFTSSQDSDLEEKFFLWITRKLAED